MKAHNISEAKKYNKQGYILSLQGKTDEALKNFDKAIYLKPDFIDAYVNRSMIFYLKGDFEKALPDCSKAITLNIHYERAYKVQGMIFLAQGKFNETLYNINILKNLNSRFADQLELRMFFTQMNIGKLNNIQIINNYGEDNLLNFNTEAALPKRNLSRKRKANNEDIFTSKEIQKSHMTSPHSNNENTNIDCNMDNKQEHDNIKDAVQALLLLSNTKTNFTSKINKKISYDIGSSDNSRSQ